MEIMDDIFGGYSDSSYSDSSYSDSSFYTLCDGIFLRQLVYTET